MTWNNLAHCKVYITVTYETRLLFWLQLASIIHSPEEVASGPSILCWVIFFHYLSLASLNGLVLYRLYIGSLNVEIA